jgi:hypothetical protein
MENTSHAPAARPGGHEEHDVDIRGIVVFVIGLTIVCLVTGVAMLALFRYLDRRLVEAEPAVSPLALPAGQLPPEPRLLTDEPALLDAYRAEQAQKLTTYGWVDREHGIARIPIERAKAWLLERGLPHRASPPSDAGTAAAARRAPDR